MKRDNLQWCLVKVVHCFLATPLAMSLHGKNVFWASVHHVINAEVALKWVGHSAEISSQRSVDASKGFFLMFENQMSR